MSITRILAAAGVASIALTGAALAQSNTNPQKSAMDEMKKDKMDNHGQDMKKDAMMKRDEMKKDGMKK